MHGATSSHATSCPAPCHVVEHSTLERKPQGEECTSKSNASAGLNVRAPLHTTKRSIYCATSEASDISITTASGSDESSRDSDACEKRWLSRGCSQSIRDHEPGNRYSRKRPPLHALFCGELIEPAFGARNRREAPLRWWARSCFLHGSRQPLQRSSYPWI